jgi:hypothetical protein
MMASTQNPLPNQTRFLLQYAAYLALLVFSLPNPGRPDSTGVVVMITIVLIFLGIGWLLFKWLHRVEWQYLQGFGVKGYARLKAIRWMTVGLITGCMVWTHWQNPELKASHFWINALLSYWSTWATVWLISLWALWPVAYYKAPTEETDYLLRTLVNESSAQTHNQKP